MKLLVRLGLIILLLAAAVVLYVRTPGYPDLGGDQDIKLYPLDQAEQNSDFLEFRRRLIQAVEDKDLDFLLSCVDDSIRYTFGVNEGVSGFLQAWELDTNPEQSRFWDEMEQVLKLGGEFTNLEKTIFTAPYVYSSFPEEIDPFQHVAITDREVKVYQEPKLSADILGVLNYSIVQNLTHNGRYRFEHEDRYWRKIESFSGHSGFVLDQYTRSPIDYRASFQFSDGTWKLIFFVAGD